MSGSISAIWDALADAGILPRDHQLPLPESPVTSSDDLLPHLVSAWQSQSDSASDGQGRKFARWLEKLAPWRARSARLTLGVPGAPVDTTARWLGRRLAWWPQGVPVGRRVALVSSRLGRAPDTEQSWFTMLRAACGKIDRERDLLLTSASTAADRYVDRAANLFGLRLLRIEVPRHDDLSLAAWFADILAGGEPQADEPGHTVLLSPTLPGATDPVDEGIASIPLRDRALVTLSDRLLAFRVRRKGNLHRLIEARLRDPAWPLASVYIGLGSRQARTEMAAQLMDAGAVGWVVFEPSAHAPDGPGGDLPIESLEKPGNGPYRGEIPCRTTSPPRSGARAKVIPFPASEDWSFLTHCTRRRAGPWPDQAEAEFLDDLILARDEADHSALAAIKRIVRQQRLIATSDAIRGTTPVVSFTAVPLAELHRLRVFRPHRGRWDFEPFGICIRRDWLEEQGARAVVYGDDQLWESLPVEDRPFFQLRCTRRATGAAAMDWTVEDEWRVAGDVDLACVPHDAALLFVPSPAEAREIAEISRWPVTVVPACDGPETVDSSAGE